ncbi:MAG TPA: long-chain fatty acid--CoA ligase [Chloroflexota bacterium]|nr:long-chain fatty acid--CoA ligase [Chloroflexota bacterium]
MDRPWYAYYDPGVPRDLERPDIALPELFLQTAQQNPRRAGTIFHDRTLTYARLWEQIEAFAGGLQALGVRHGDRVAIMLPNLPQFVVSFFGTLRCGAIAVPTNPLYTQRELEYQLADSEAIAIVTLDPLFPRVQAALPASKVNAVIVCGIGPALPRHLQPLFALKERRAGRLPIRPGGVVYRYESLLNSRPTSSLHSVSAGDTAVLQYTGGTTGYSKAAMLTHRNLIANAVQAHAWQGTSVSGDVRVLCAIPFFHVYGLSIAMNLSVVSAATMLLVPRWIPKDVARVARRYRPQIFPGVPTMYVALPAMPGRPERSFSSLQVCMSGAAPLQTEVQQRFEAMSGARVVEGYGLSEAGPVTHCNPILGERRAGTVGVPFPGTDAMITDPETWEPLPPGAIGEMTVRGPQVMQGYWNRPDETLAVLRDGWLHTGDMATMDVDGYFRIVDRKKDVIIASGYNVYPREVEETLLSHPKIAEAAVVGVPSDYRGETVKAVLVLRDGETASAEEIIAFCKERLAIYKVPKVVEMRDELPKSLIGKVLRRQLRDEHLAAQMTETGTG